MYEIAKDVVVYGSFVIAGAVVALNGIAPLTKTDKDDKLVNGLRWVQDKILSILLPMVTAAKASAKATATTKATKTE